MAGKTFNVGVVGYGMSATIFHIPFIATTPQLTLHSIVQRSPKDGSSAPRDHPGVKHYTDLKQLLADPEVDVVIITTPSNLHFEQTKAVLDAGKHVLTEKPFVPTVAEAEKLIKIAKEKNLLICVFQNRRWDSDFLTLKHVVAEGTVGRILEFDNHYDRYRPVLATNSWKGQLNIAEGGSALFDLGSHIIDQAYMLFGMPQGVYGKLLCQREGKLDYDKPDAVSAELRYPGGVLVHIRISSVSAEASQPRFWLRGTKGSFHKYGVDPQEDQLKAGMKATDPGFGKESTDTMRIVVAGPNNEMQSAKVPELEPATYRQFYAELGSALESGKEEDLPVKASEARDVLRIIEAVIESAKTGREVTF